MSYEYGSIGNPICLNNDISFMIDRDTPPFPTDKNDIPIHVDDTLHLLHNDKISKVRILHYCGNGIWHVFLDDSGGGFSLPESKNNVEHLFPWFFIKGV